VNTEPDPPRIRFDDGASYETFMGVWSRTAGEAFLDWLAPQPGLRWVDVGCGNGAFTELLLGRAQAAHVEGIDPAEAQIAYARTRLATAPAHVAVGDAMALPFGDAEFDAAVMALVVFFVPDPPRALAEMARVTRPGGSVSAYAWDILEGGFPYAAVQEEMAALGTPQILPPSAEASRTESLRRLWADAGLVEIATVEIAVERTFADFAAFWAAARTGPRIAPALASMPGGTSATLEGRVRARLGAAPDGTVTVQARANAVRGRVAEP
jgi:ubiquinone/menaquinone biosynthesis C-methylase UbiE